jgi:hypothetical protein
MAFNVQDFKARGLQFHGARPTLFQVEINNPPAGIASNGAIDKLRFMCNATQLPAPIVDKIPVGYMGREINVSGDRTVPDWNISVINDEDFGIREMFENWSFIQNSMVGNLRRDRGYKADGTITQYGKEGNVLRQYTMVGAFPTMVGQIEVAWEAKNQIEIFNVTLALDWWEPNKTGNGSNGGLAGGLFGA